MNHFPHNPLFKRPAAPAVSSLGSVRPRRLRDVLWGQPLFKAPDLPVPDTRMVPIPVTSSRFPRKTTHP